MVGGFKDFYRISDVRFVSETEFWMAVVLAEDDGSYPNNQFFRLYRFQINHDFSDLEGLGSF